MAQPDKVATIAALRAVTGQSDGDVYYVQGYSSRLDGGEGWFEYDSGSSRNDDGGTWIEPTSGGGAWRRQHTDGDVNVRWFGAKGDGTTNDYQAFRNAIDSLAPVSDPSHGTEAAYAGRVYVPRSEQYYVIDPVAGGAPNGYLEINRSVEICGANFGSSFAGTALRLTDGGISVTPANDILENPRGDFATFRNLWIRGSRQLYHGILVRARCQIYDCKVSHFGWDGVFIDGVFEADLIRNANNTRIYNLSVENCAGYGLHARGSDANTVWFYGVFGSGNGMASFRLSPFLGGAMFGSSTEATVGHSQLFPNTDGEYRYTYAVPSEGISIGDKIDITAQFDEDGDPIPDETDNTKKLGYYVDGDANRFLLAATYCENDARKVVLGPQAILISHVGSGGYDQIFPTEGDNMPLVMVDAANVSPMVIRSGTPGTPRRTAVSLGSANGRKILGWRTVTDPSGGDSNSWDLVVRPEENRAVLAVEGAPGVGDANVALEIPDADGSPLGALRFPQGYALSDGGSVTIAAAMPDNADGADGDVAISNAIGSVLGWKKISGSWVPIVRVVQVPSSEIAAITKIQNGG